MECGSEEGKLMGRGWECIQWEKYELQDFGEVGQMDEGSGKK